MNAQVLFLKENLFSKIQIDLVPPESIVIHSEMSAQIFNLKKSFFMEKGT